MATVVDEPLGDVWYQGLDCRIYVSYDDTTFRVSNFKVENDMTVPCKIVATAYSNGAQMSFTIQPGQYITQSLKGNQVYFENAWSVFMLALV